MKYLGIFLVTFVGMFLFFTDQSALGETAQSNIIKIRCTQEPDAVAIIKYNKRTLHLDVRIKSSTEKASYIGEAVYSYVTYDKSSRSIERIIATRYKNDFTYSWDSIDKGPSVVHMGHSVFDFYPWNCKRESH